MICIMHVVYVDKIFVQTFACIYENQNGIVHIPCSYAEIRREMKCIIRSRISYESILDQT